MRAWLGLIVGLTASCVATCARAEPPVEVPVLAAMAMAASLRALEPEIRAQGVAPRLELGTAGWAHDQVADGAPGDVVLALPAQLDDLTRRGLVVAQSRRRVALARLGVAVKIGAPMPDIATAAALKRAFLATPSLGLADPAAGATTGIYFARMLHEQGMEAALVGRLHLYPDGTSAMRALARGEVELAAGQVSEIVPVAGVQLVGRLPSDLQLLTIYEAGIASHAQAPDAAAKLVAVLMSDAATPVLAALGLERP